MSLFSKQGGNIMDFLEIAHARQSCRSYDETRPVEPEKLQ